ncbi:MAG: hypothetical protein WDW38_003018 [Sanguina aurantia]
MDGDGRTMQALHRQVLPGKFVLQVDEAVDIGVAAKERTPAFAPQNPNIAIAMRLWILSLISRTFLQQQQQQQQPPSYPHTPNPQHGAPHNVAVPRLQPGVPPHNTASANNGRQPPGGQPPPSQQHAHQPHAHASLGQGHPSQNTSPPHRDDAHPQQQEQRTQRGDNAQHESRGPNTGHHVQSSNSGGSHGQRSNAPVHAAQGSGHGQELHPLSTAGRDSEPSLPPQAFGDAKPPAHDGRPGPVSASVIASSRPILDDNEAAASSQPHVPPRRAIAATASSTGTSQKRPPDTEMSSSSKRMRTASHEGDSHGNSHPSAALPGGLASTSPPSPPRPPQQRKICDCLEGALKSKLNGEYAGAPTPVKLAPAAVQQHGQTPGLPDNTLPQQQQQQQQQQKNTVQNLQPTRTTGPRSHQQQQQQPEFRQAPNGGEEAALHRGPGADDSHTWAHAPHMYLHRLPEFLAMQRARCAGASARDVRGPRSVYVHVRPTIRSIKQNLVEVEDGSACIDVTLSPQVRTLFFGLPEEELQDLVESEDPRQNATAAHHMEQAAVRMREFSGSMILQVSLSAPPGSGGAEAASHQQQQQQQSNSVGGAQQQQQLLPVVVSLQYLKGAELDAALDQMMKPGSY